MKNNQKNLDDIIKKFEEESKDAISSNRHLWENDKEKDDLYNVDIHIWRKSGMGNSLQTIAGNKLSIMVATSSFLQTLIEKDVISKDELDQMINMVKEQTK